MNSHSPSPSLDDAFSRERGNFGCFASFLPPKPARFFVSDITKEDPRSLFGTSWYPHSKDELVRAEAFGGLCFSLEHLLHIWNIFCAFGKVACHQHASLRPQCLAVGGGGKGRVSSGLKKHSPPNPNSTPPVSVLQGSFSCIRLLDSFCGDGAFWPPQFAGKELPSCSSNETTE